VDTYLHSDNHLHTPPKISVCIPTFNTARYLAEAIESVLGQTFTDYELVVYDDASTDETPEVMRRFADPRLRYVRSEHNLGQAGAWDRCVSLASGEYVALLHADDVYLSGFLDQRVSVLDANPTVGLAFGAVQLIDQNGVATAEKQFAGCDTIWPAPQFLGTLLLDCVIYPPSVMIRRDCYRIVGGFNDAYYWGIDWDFWLRLAANYGVAYSSRIAAAYRVHLASATPAAFSMARTSSDGLEILNQIFRKIDQTPALSDYRILREPAYRTFAMRALSAAGYTCEKGIMHAARTHLHYALSAAPTLRSRPTVWVIWLASYLGSWLYRGFCSIRRP